VNRKLKAVLTPIRAAAIVTAIAAVTVGICAADARPVDSVPGATTSPAEAQPAEAVPAPAAGNHAPDARPAEAANAPPAETNAPEANSADAAPVADAGSPPADQQPDDASRVINWVLASRDNGELPFIVIDKVGAEMFVFDAVGQSMGHAPVLVGITKGDDSSPGVGDRELSHIPLAQRTTPAGRFVAKFGPASGRESVLWVDYGDAISLHPVITSNPKEHRLKRLNSPTSEDNRITFGCINVPKAFYRNVVRPLFLKTGGIIYILPEIRSLNEAFPAGQFPSQPGSPSDIAR